MKIGFVSAILGDYSFEKMLDTAAELGFDCVEVCCWPVGKAERRYAGVSHINVDELDADKIREIKEYCKKTGVEISSLGYYPNVMDGDSGKAEFCIEHLKKVIKASAALDIKMVTTFIGRHQWKSVEDNLALLEKTWGPIIALAEDLNVRIGIENCPMLFGNDQWPGGQNLMTSPANWKAVFDILPSKNLGINYDPSHFVWQMIDYIKPLYEFSDKIFHVHFKDIKLYPDKLDKVGIMAYPLDFMAPKIPGLGDVNWGKFVSALTDIGFKGYACIEVEDRSFEESEEDILNSLRLSKRYIENFVI